MARRGNYPEYLKCPCFRLVNYIALLILIYVYMIIYDSYPEYVFEISNRQSARRVMLEGGGPGSTR